jgi:hypothetical protein
VCDVCDVCDMLLCDVMCDVLTWRATCVTWRVTASAGVAVRVRQQAVAGARAAGSSTARHASSAAQRLSLPLSLSLSRARARRVPRLSHHVVDRVSGLGVLQAARVDDAHAEAVHIGLAHSHLRWRAACA